MTMFLGLIICVFFLMVSRLMMGEFDKVLIKGLAVSMLIFVTIPRYACTWTTDRNA